MDIIANAYPLAYLPRERGGLYFPPWMAPTELAHQLALVRRGVRLHLSVTG